MKDNAFLANAGHFDIEINLNDLDSIATGKAPKRDNIIGYEINSKTLNVLAEGRLVNLASGNGHPAEIMDMSFSVQFLSLKWLLHNRSINKNIVYEVPPTIDRIVSGVKLKSMNLQLDTLTPDQEEYYGYH